jgi:hypothetical protein
MGGKRGNTDVLQLVTESFGTSAVWFLEHSVGNQ